MKKNQAGNPFANVPGMRNMRCPYCKSPVQLRSADGIYKENKDNAMLYICSRYPECNAYVRVHPGTNKPMGSLADHRLRSLRQQAHKAFDRLYLSGYMTRNEAYSWLAGIIQAPRSQAHIGYLGEYYCQLVIDESKKLLQHGPNAKQRRQDTVQAKAIGGA